jgi:hypothetical protein
MEQTPNNSIGTPFAGNEKHACGGRGKFECVWAQDTKRDAATINKEIEEILQKDATAPMSGLWGEKMVNVLQVNLDLRQKYGATTS